MSAGVASARRRAAGRRREWLRALQASAEWAREAPGSTAVPPPGETDPPGAAEPPAEAGESSS